MPFGLKDTDLKLIKNVFHLFSKVEEVTVFGSRAMGTEKPGSDIDLAVKGNDINLDDILSIKHKLEEIPLVYEFDVINYNTINTPALIEHIDSHGIQFYKKEVAPNNWITLNLNTACSKITDGSHFSPKEYPIGKRMIASVKDMNEYGFDIKNCKKISEEDYITLVKNGCKPELGDVLFSKDGTMGIVQFFKKELDLVLLSSIAILKPDKSKIDGEFLAYYLKNPKTNIDIQDNFKSGSALPRIVLKDFKKLNLVIPESKDTQRSISSIFSSLDHKIELNLQMNQTLEAMAQAIFKEWFVNFNFPGFDGQLVNGLPKRWRIESIGRIGKVITGTTPSSSTPGHFGDYLPFITPTDFKSYSKLIFSSSRYLSKEGSYSLKNRVLPINSIIVTCIGSDMGKIAINKVECITNQQINSIVLESTNSITDYIYYSLVNRYDLLRNMATGGSTMPIINKTQFEGIEIIVPDSDLLKKYQTLMDSFNGKIGQNVKQNQNLTQLRDSLLPKLMTGKIEVN